MKKVLVSFIVSGLVMAGVALRAAPPVQAPPEPGNVNAQKAPSRAEIITVEAGQVGGSVALGGTVIPYKMVNMLAQIPGDVEFLAGLEGDRFSKGDVLVKLDISSLLAKREQALTQLASAQAGYRNSIIQYQRQIVAPKSQSDDMLGGMPSMFGMFTDPMRSMMGQGAPGYERYSNLSGQGTQVETSANSIRQAQAAIREIDDNIENAISRAPFDGVIINKMVEVGDIVQPGMPLVSFADTRRMQVQVEVPSRLLSQLKVGAPVKVRLDRDGPLAAATVARIFPMAQTGGHTTTVKFNLAPDVDVHSGTYAEVLLQDTRRMGSSLPLIPESAIVWRGSLPAVFMVTQDNQLKMKVLRIGASTSDGRVSVISGIKPGDRILKNPSPSTQSGPLEG